MVLSVIVTSSLRIKKARARVPSTSLFLIVILGIRAVFCIKQVLSTPDGNELKLIVLLLNEVTVAVPTKVQSLL